MPESGLSIHVFDLRKFVGDIGLQYGQGVDPVWTDAQLSDIKNMVGTGLRYVYVPPVLPGESVPHIWSWLKPTQTIVSTVDSQDYLNADDDFGGIQGDMYHSDGSANRPLRGVPHEFILRKRGASSSTGVPIYYSITPVQSFGISGQRFRFNFWPTPDAAYDLTFVKVINPQDLSEDNPYPLGGMQLVETIKQACLAACENHVERMRGPQWDLFMVMLASAIARDRKNQPSHIGHQTAWVGGPMPFRNNRSASGIVTYNGVDVS